MFKDKAVEAIGLAFDEILAPILDEIGIKFGVLIGKPNCNGNVMKDTISFLPFEPFPSITLSKLYTASKQSGCGHPARTQLDLTYQRRTLESGGFGAPMPSTPKDITLFPVVDQKIANWHGSWAEDGHTLYPKIVCSITAADNDSKKLSVSIHEVIDSRSDVNFQVNLESAIPEPKNAFPPYLHNIFSYIKPNSPFSSQPMLTAVHDRSAKVGSVSNSIKPAGIQLKMNSVSAPRWNYTPVISAEGDQNRLITANKPSLQGGGLQIIQADAVILSDRGVKLSLYEIRVGNSSLANAVRYQREEKGLFTSADVMLVKWNPVR